MGGPLRQPIAGDVVVTKIAEHYHVGRVQVAGTPLIAIQQMNSVSDALTLACQLVTGSPSLDHHDACSCTTVAIGFITSRSAAPIQIGSSAN